MARNTEPERGFCSFGWFIDRSLPLLAVATAARLCRARVGRKSNAHSAIGFQCIQRSRGSSERRNALRFSALCLLLVVIYTPRLVCTLVVGAFLTRWYYCSPAFGRRAGEGKRRKMSRRESVAAHHRAPLTQP